MAPYRSHLAKARADLARRATHGQAALLEIHYHDVLQKPLKVAEQIARFISDDGFVPLAAATAVDPSLCHASGERHVRTGFAV